MGRVKNPSVNIKITEVGKKFSNKNKFVVRKEKTISLKRIGSPIYTPHSLTSPLSLQILKRDEAKALECFASE